MNAKPKSNRHSREYVFVYTFLVPQSEVYSEQYEHSVKCLVDSILIDYDIEAVYKL